MTLPALSVKRYHITKESVLETSGNHIYVTKKMVPSGSSDDAGSTMRKKVSIQIGISIWYF